MPSNRILVIEEEALLALDIEDILTEAALGDITHYRSVAQARPHFADLATCRLAIVESRFGSPEVVAFTERLAKAGVAIVVMSADYGSTEAFPHAIALGKPFDAAGLVAACLAAQARVS